MAMLTPQEIETHLKRIETDGYTILAEVIAPHLLDELLADLRRIELERSSQPADNLFEGYKTVRIYNLLTCGKRFEEIPVHENVLPLVERVLDRGCLVSSLSSIRINPGEQAQPIHADDQLIPLPKPHVPIVCNTMWALTDFTEENGATRVIPGSHRSADSPVLGQSYESIPAVMKRGSVLVYHGSLWHGGGANYSDRSRVGVAMNYCAGYIRQQENQQLGIPLEVAKGFAPRLRKLIGYGLYKGLLGHIDKCSPVDLLDGTSPRVVVGKPSL
jgi:ectoine hydroxylase-related dioxygenase (phytanoyl-CoA dioxygenase family)